MIFLVLSTAFITVSSTTLTVSGSEVVVFSGVGVSLSSPSISKIAKVSPTLTTSSA